MYVNSFSCQLHDVAWKIIISVKEGHLIFFLFGLNFSKISQYYSVIIIIISELIQKKKKLVKQLNPELWMVWLQNGERKIGQDLELRAHTDRFSLAETWEYVHSVIF